MADGALGADTDNESRENKVTQVLIGQDFFILLPFLFVCFLSADIITPSNLLLMMSVLMDGANELISNYSVGVIFTNNSCHISNNSNVAR